MSELDWRRPLEEVLGDDETARRQLAEHAQLLPIADARTSLRFMAARLREHWVSTLLTLVITIGGAVAAAILPRLIGSAVDVVAAGGPTDRVWTLGGQILAVGVIQAVLMALGWWMISALGQRILAGMREDVIDRALDLPAQTMETTGIGDALSRVADDVDVAARAVNNLVPNLIQLGFLVLITL
ncbi:MAG: ABC transporter ATP-binding protein, partial [Brachybacterium sp.]|nr:ABC transporter ATP-binding protein [Brachybacterium sp.]